MKKIYSIYINAFKGLSEEVWWLALVTLINRAGTMVIPFLSLYLTNQLQFSLSQVGWIMSCFGVGSVIGSWLGGKLTDELGYFKVMTISLVLTGIGFVALQYAESFIEICTGIILVMIVADCFRPAIFVALNAYSKPENKTRSLTLIRLAINLGFSAGPAVGGLIITGMGYKGLFWIDGITCLLAALLMIKVLNPKKAKILDKHEVNNPIPISKDYLFWLFFTGMIIFGFIFMQYFSTMPVYYRDVHNWSESNIGLLLGMNGLIIFLFEMPLIKWLENSHFGKLQLVNFGLFLTGLSLLVLLTTSWSGIIIVGMLLATVGEMIAFPFSNAFVLERSKRGKQGEYMAFYSIAFSISHIVAHNLGMQLINNSGFDFTWGMMTVLAVIGMILLQFLIYRLKAISKLTVKVACKQTQKAL